MKRLSLPAAFGVVLALLFAGLGGAPAFAGSNPVPIYLKADPCPGASLCGNFLTGQFKGSGKRTTQFAALPNLTVTRASFAYGENADGSLKGFQAGQARLTSKGLGVFEATTNLALWSEDLTNAAWTKALTTVTAGAYTAPNATGTGQKLAETASTGIHQVFPAAGYTVSASTIGTYTVFLAPAERTTARVVNADAGATNGGLADINLQSCTIIGTPTTLGAGSNVTASAQMLVNGWCRVRLSAQASTSTTVFVAVRITQSAGVDSYAGTAGSGIYVWGQDFRSNASYPVPYCPTTASTATCAADNVSIAGLNLAGGQTLAAWLESPVTTSGDRWILQQGLGQPGIKLANTTTSFLPSIPGTADGNVVANAAINQFRVATAFANGSQLTSANGVTGASSSIAYTPGASTLYLGESSTATNPYNGYIKAFLVAPTVWTQSQLNAWTAGPDTSSFSLNFASGLYKTTTPYVRTNNVRNSVAAGAVAGTPGTAPTNWAISCNGNGLSTQVIGSGTDASTGFGYVDARFFGTTTGTQGCTVAFEGGQQIAAANGQTWTASSYVALSGGSLTNVSLFTAQDMNNSSGTYLANTTPTGFTPTATATRYWNTGTFNQASTAFAKPYIIFSPGSGKVVDVTLRVEAPQDEQTSYPTSAILTTGAAASVATAQSTQPQDVGALTFTNSTGGYGQFSNGTLQWFPANAPRCTDQGCLIEEAATNLETYSQDSSQWTPTNVVVTTGQLAPDGTATAFQVSSTANLNSFVASPIITLANNTTYTSSLYFKPVSGTGVIAIEYTTGTTLVGPTCNALTGSTTNGAVITTYGNGWSRCTVTFTTAATGTPSARVAYVGAYGATATPTTVLLWQKDIVAKAFATSPIPTTSASATRSADVMSYAYTPPTTGTLATSWSAPITPADQFPAFLSDGTLNNRVHFAQSATTGNLNAVVNNGGAVTSFSTANVVTGSGVACGALSYTGGAQIASLNGGTNATAAGATIPTTLSTLTVGGGGAATAARQLNGYVRDVAVFAYAANSNETPYRAACNF